MPINYHESLGYVKDRREGCEEMLTSPSNGDMIKKKPPSIDSLLGGERARGGRVSLPLAYQKISVTMR